ncbi:DcrB-related protein, partial [Salmonella enterica]|uniref:DcrB-related protein n=1 Tax=Salmonella enterica TaxID=28901 RepID=UPI00398C7EAC
MDRPYRIQAGCFVLPETFTDSTVKIVILEGNERTRPRLNISRDNQKYDEAIHPSNARQLYLRNNKPDTPRLLSST